MTSQEKIKQLVKASLEGKSGCETVPHQANANTLAQKYAYCPYSKFRVGAALLSKSGKIYTGKCIRMLRYLFVLNYDG
jgi:cytidine deaminase